MSENSSSSIPVNGESELIRDGSYSLALAVTSNALSNGQATNSATAHLSRRGVPQSHRRITFQVTGNARFTNGGRFISIRTDAHGKATAFFTDDQPEGVTVSGHFGDSLAFRNVYFRSGNIGVSVEVWANNSPSDSTSANQLFYHVYDSRTQLPIANAILDFRVVIGQARLSVTTATTTPDGAFLLSIFKPEPGRVLIGAQMRDYPDVNNYTYVTFSEKQAQYRLTVQVLEMVPGGGVPIIATLIDISTGLPVPGKRIKITCGAIESFNGFIGPTGQDGTARQYYGNVPGAINHMLASLEEDETVNAPFILVF